MKYPWFHHATLILIMLLGIVWIIVLVNISMIASLEDRSMKSAGVRDLWRQFFEANPQLKVPEDFIPFEIKP